MARAQPLILQKPKPPSISKIQGPVRIKSAQYEGSAKWSVMWGGRAIEVTMPPDWVKRFQANEIAAPPGTTLMVEMDQEVVLDDKGEALSNPTYTVTKISDVIAPPKQDGTRCWA